MADICGIIADLKREDNGVYVFPRLTLMGLENSEISDLKSAGFSLEDANTRYEGVEVSKTSPYKVLRSLARIGSYAAMPEPAVTATGGANCPGARTMIMWNLKSGDRGLETIGIISDIRREGEGEYVIPSCSIFGLNDDEVAQLGQHGLKVTDENKRHEGIEVTGASPFKVMRVLCKHYGWSLDSKVSKTDNPGSSRFVGTCIWQLTRNL